MMTKTSILLATATLAFGVMAAPVHASNAAAMTPAQINAQHDAATKKCDTMKGNDKDVCNKQADADKDQAKANAKAAKQKAEANHDAAKVKREGDYKVAVEKCDALSGDAKDACKTNAKTQFGK